MRRHKVRFIPISSGGSVRMPTSMRLDGVFGTGGTSVLFVECELIERGTGTADFCPASAEVRWRLMPRSPRGPRPRPGIGSRSGSSPSSRRGKSGRGPASPRWRARASIRVWDSNRRPISNLLMGRALDAKGWCWEWACLAYYRFQNLHQRAQSHAFWRVNRVLAERVGFVHLRGFAAYGGSHRVSEPSTIARS
jgi:hypothetical protein